MIKNGAKFFLCLLMGVVLSYSQAPHHYWFLIIPVFSIFYYLYTTFDSKRAVFFASFLFGIGYFVSGLHWIGNALLVEGNEFKWVWPLAVIALPTLLSLFTALSVTVSHFVAHKKTWVGFLVFCAALSLSEFIRGYIFTGFPWNLYGYTWLGLMPIAQSVSVIGPFGLTFLTIIWGASLGHLYLHKKKTVPLFIIVILSFFLTFTCGYYRITNTNIEYFVDVQMHIVQPNIEQASKWKPTELARNFERHLALSQVATNKKTVIVWPETAIPPSLISSITVKERFKSLLSGDRILLSGALAVMPDKESKKLNYHNGLFLFNGVDEPQNLYSKSHLVPFGEYIPFQEYIPLNPVVSFTGFQKGNGPTTLDLEGFPNPSPQVCYEIIFSNRAVNKEQPRPDYILAVTNDAWYGDSAGPRQHFAIAQFRAIEQGLSVVRSANTGISGLITPLGTIEKNIALQSGGFISAELPKPLNKNTFYSKFGDILFFFTVFFIFLFGCFHRKI